jgi:23S rRNA (guanosine2251-2'-O)-methyltransferase
MAINKTYAVFGLGRYGRSVAEELINSGAEVLAVDINQDNVHSAIETIPVHEAVNLTQTLETLKEKGFWVYGTDARHAVDYRAPKYDTPVVLVIGSEGKGISRLVLEHCDQKIMLPMHGSVTSLNASVATAICLYEILSKRNPL